MHEFVMNVPNVTRQKPDSVRERGFQWFHDCQISGQLLQPEGREALNYTFCACE